MIVLGTNLALALSKYGLPHFERLKVDKRRIVEAGVQVWAQAVYYSLRDSQTLPPGFERCRCIVGYTYCLKKHPKRDAVILSRC